MPQEALPASAWRVRLFLVAALLLLSFAVAQLIADSRKIVAGSERSPRMAAAEITTPARWPESTLLPSRSGAAVSPGVVAQLEEQQQSLFSAAALLQQHSVRARREAIETIGSIRHRGAVHLLLAALHDTDNEVRELAVEALADHGADAIDALAVSLHDASADVRLETIDALAEIDSEQARSLLQLALADTDPRIRAAAADLLN
ncbi:MAG: hypothetical protein HKO55_04445 [Gammaproteobacteria bacterium]|nr:hypothetical protein [Gammaproteobacteria bacterium]